MHKLTAVSIRTWNRSRTWFLMLPVVDGKVYLPGSKVLELTREWDLPQNATISIG